MTSPEIRIRHVVDDTGDSYHVELDRQRATELVICESTSDVVDTVRDMLRIGDI